MQAQLRLYGTEGCHLCEQASTLLRSLKLDWENLDIIDDDALLERYGSRIPVLVRIDCGKELDWPFQLADIERLLQNEAS